jgi:hypothetical protein
MAVAVWVRISVEIESNELYPCPQPKVDHSTWLGRKGVDRLGAARNIERNRLVA